MKSGTGVVVALPHAGNWDHAGSYFCAMGFPLVTVAERLKPEALFNKFLEYRQNIGM
jgi:KDO2-lipid IV(A) lauroyltransferase